MRELIAFLQKPSVKRNASILLIAWSLCTIGVLVWMLAPASLYVTAALVLLGGAMVFHNVYARRIELYFLARRHPEVLRVADDVARRHAPELARMLTASVRWNGRDGYDWQAWHEELRDFIAREVAPQLAPADLAEIAIFASPLRIQVGDILTQAGISACTPEWRQRVGIAS